MSFLEIDFLVFLIEGSDIYLLLLIPWKNIDSSRSYCWSKVSNNFFVLVLITFPESFMMIGQKM